MTSSSSSSSCNIRRRTNKRMASSKWKNKLMTQYTIENGSSPMCDDSARQSWGRGRHHRYVESWILLFYCVTTTTAFHRTAPRYCELSIVSGGGGSWFVADSIWWILTRHCVALHCIAQYVNGIKWSVQCTVHQQYVCVRMLTEQTDNKNGQRQSQ